MPIIKMVPKYCYCAGKPDTKSYGEGTVWECDNPDYQPHWELQFMGWFILGQTLQR